MGIYLYSMVVDVVELLDIPVEVKLPVSGVARGSVCLAGPRVLRLEAHRGLHLDITGETSGSGKEKERQTFEIT